ncbi:MAG: PQQ-binding-like beta-propeller repeat protein [Streptosporangiaceae bacterium]
MGTPVEDAVPRRRGSKVQGYLVGSVAMVAVGVAATILFLVFKAVIVESGGGCGSSSRGAGRGACPEGSGKLFFLSFVPLFVLVPLALWGVRTVGRTVGCTGGAVLVLLGVYPGIVIFDWGHGRTLDVAWTVPRARGGVDAEGFWFTDTVAVRARVDGLFAFDQATGAPKWVFDIPRPDVLCGMSRTAGSGVGVIAYGPEDKPCGHFAAVDLASGRTKWTKDIPPHTGSADGVVAEGGGTVVIRESLGKLTALSLVDGGASWTSEAPGSLCRYDQVASGPDQIVALLNCSGELPKAVAFDPVSGRVRWRTPVSAAGSFASVELYSASPAVMKVRETGARGRTTVQSFDASGHAVVSYTASDDHDLTLSTNGFEATPRHDFVITGGMIVGATRVGYDDGVTAFRLGDGQRMWLTKLDHGLETLAVDGANLVVLGDDGATPSLTAVDLATGEKKRLGGFDVDDLANKIALHAANGRYTLVSESTSTLYDALIGVR